MSAEIKLCRKIRSPAQMEAFQFVDNCRHQGKLWPDWLHDAWKNGSFWVSDNFDLTTGISRGFEWILDESGASQNKIKINDWIIRDLNCDLTVCPADAFDKVYEDVPKEHRQELVADGKRY